MASGKSTMVKWKFFDEKIIYKWWILMDNYWNSIYESMKLVYN